MKTIRGLASLIALVALTSACDASGHARHKAPTRARLAEAEIATPATPAAPAPQPSMTLEEALAIAYETNPELAAAQAGLRAADEQVAQANGAWRPTITVGASYGFEKYFFPPIPINGGGTVSSVTDHPLNGQATITQPLFRSGRTIAEISRAKALVRAGRAQLTASEQTVLLAAATAYMNVVRDQAIVDLRVHNVEVLRKQRDATRLEFKAGSVTRTDVAQSEARLATAQSDLTAAQGQLSTSRADFMRAIGRPAETLETDPALPKLSTEEDAVLALALKQNPSVLSAQANERAANYAVNDAWGAMGPSLSVQGQYYYSQSALNSVQGFGAGGTTASVTNHAVAVLGQLTVPIYQAGVEEANVRQSRELHAQSELNIAVSDRQVRDAVAAAWSGFQAALSAIDSNAATEKADEIAFEGVSKEQQVGGRTVLDVLNAEQELLNAQVALVTSRRDAVVAAYQVLATEGALTAKALGLKVKLYDPLEHYDEDAAAWIGFGN
ncbi:MAG TPA: TolC family outer membrane protein [Rhizomicrobium sp.]|nr:TolC family outer membrane protein [Rhizomicrobium sp.]